MNIIEWVMVVVGGVIVVSMGAVCLAAIAPDLLGGAKVIRKLYRGKN